MAEQANEPDFATRLLDRKLVTSGSSLVVDSPCR